MTPSLEPWHIRYELFNDGKAYPTFFSASGEIIGSMVKGVDADYILEAIAGHDNSSNEIDLLEQDKEELELKIKKLEAKIQELQNRLEVIRLEAQKL